MDRLYQLLSLLLAIKSDWSHSGFSNYYVDYIVEIVDGWISIGKAVHKITSSLGLY
jgi:hypothetical protein